ncbi:AsmA family protein [Bartonella tamiae]|uniref:AsmA domain-containing protein n=1 Tax=Bartonella tamiae Th239 TaxID=1094558 RepID=J1JWJ0_9HYPH|nr:AsmA family protein [Bartonella tamiae]EJF89382.1 hypothetical protein ME5_01933 [Bartonella tamiae Th239]EJF92753.1 hypothetical protein MEG_01923 [Bartonella tamiae Th307]
MSRLILKILLGFFIIVLLSVTAIAIALPYLVSTDAIRVRLAQELSTWTGYNVQLRKAPHLTLFPTPRASLSGVTLTPMLNDASPLMEAECIEVNLSLFDALLGRVSFSETRIIRPHFVMEEPIKTVAEFFNTMSQSQGSFGLAVREAQNLVDNDPNHPDIKKLLNQPFGKITVQDGDVLYRKIVGGMAEKITGLNATLEWPESNRAASFQANARWRGQLTELRLDAAQALLLLAGGTSDVRASLNSVRGGVTFSGKATMKDNFYLDGQIWARSPGWDKTMDWLGESQILGQSIKAPVVWESGFVAQPGRAQFNDVLFNLGEDSARGALDVDYQQEKPSLTGSLAFESLDLNKLVMIFFPDDEGGDNLDLSLLDQVSVDVRVSAPKAMVGAVDMNNIAASIQIKNGNGIFDLGNASAFDGSLQSNIQINRQGENVAIEGRVSGAGIDIDLLAKAMKATSFIHAKTGLILTFNAPFSRWSAVENNITGHITLNMLQGSLDGYYFNDPSTLFKEKDGDETLTLARAENVETQFDRWDIEADFAKDTLNLDKSLMRFGEWTLVSQGTISRQRKEKVHNNYDVQLSSMLAKTHYSENFCPDTLCLKESLQRPFRFLIKGHLLDNEKQSSKDDAVNE